MLIIGLTGATGAGKGLFGSIASEKYGAVHIDTDKTARLVVEKGKPCLEEIKAYFGEAVVNDDGTLNRPALANIVFSDKQKLEKLNEITHKFITAEVNAVLDKAKADGARAAIIDAPLLFESGEDRLCHVTVGVVARTKMRKAGIMLRDGISEDMADKRIASGKAPDFFREKCDFVIENNGNTDDFEESITELLDKLIVKNL